MDKGHKASGEFMAVIKPVKGKKAAKKGARVEKKAAKKDGATIGTDDTGAG